MDNLVANPKCKSCKSYWKPCETDILTSGLVAKTCKRCRDYQKELRENRDFSKGKIYVIKSLTSPEIYVGSTINTIDVRMTGHRNDWKNNECLGKQKDIVKDITEWFIELYEEYPCKNITELRRREGDIITLIGTLNKNIAGQTKEEWYKKNEVKLKADQKIYYNNRIEYFKEYGNQYNKRDGIKEKRTQQRRDSRARNKALKKQALLSIVV